MKAASDGFDVQNLVLDGDGFGFSGSAELDSDHALQSADIAHLSLHPGDDIALKLTRGKAGYGITARGKSFDLRGVVTHIRDRNDESGGFPDLAIDARIDRLVGFNQEEVDGASLTLVSVGGETQKVAFAGKLEGDDLSLNFNVAPDATTLQANANDAGSLLRFIDLYTHVNGGVVSLSGKADHGGPLLGTLQIDNFDVVNEPAMAKVISRNPNGTGGDQTSNPDRCTSTACWRATSAPTACSPSRTRCSPATRWARRSPAATTCPPPTSTWPARISRPMPSTTCSAASRCWGWRSAAARAKG
ncbi:MAG: hypothetical protein WDM84_09815 [Bauldia sp.]